MPFLEVDKSTRVEDWSLHEFHSHPHYEIYFLSKGSRTFFLSNAMYTLTAPTLVVIPPRTVHKTEGGSFERYNINVSPSFLDPFQKEVLEEKSLQIISLSSEEEKAFYSLVVKAHAVDKNERHQELILKALFSYGIYLLSRAGTRRILPKAAAEQDIPPLVLKVMDYLNVHYNEEITLDFLAEKFFVSKATLIYNFKKHTGHTLIDYLLTVRITKAKQLLVSSNKGIREISELCGFSSANYFGLIFKKRENLSPAAYRKNQREKF